MVNLKGLVLVFLGGGLGSALRYIIGLFFLQSLKTYFPWGTLTVNLVGCFLLGLLLGLAQSKKGISDDLVLLFGTGLCGGFTTFSTFSIEANELLKSGQWLLFLGYLIGSIGFGMALAMWGLRTGKEI